MKSLEIQIDRNNVEQQMAFDIVANTNTCLFITGKAGTGKTTFVKRIQEALYIILCKRRIRDSEMSLVFSLLLIL